MKRYLGLCGRFNGKWYSSPVSTLSLSLQQVPTSCVLFCEGTQNIHFSIQQVGILLHVYNFVRERKVNSQRPVLFWWSSKTLDQVRTFTLIDNIFKLQFYRARTYVFILCLFCVYFVFILCLFCELKHNVCFCNQHSTLSDLSDCTPTNQLQEVFLTGGCQPTASRWPLPFATFASDCNERSGV